MSLPLHLTVTVVLLVEVRPPICEAEGSENTRQERKEPTHLEYQVKSYQKLELSTIVHQQLRYGVFPAVH
jgi:hypothetical protein